MIKIPEYVDGYFELFRIAQDTSSDYPREILEDQKMELCYREISVYDRTKYELEQGGKEVTMKIRIPRYKGVDSRNVCKIDGEYHIVYNATHVVNKDGFAETELTLMRPDKELE